MNFSSLLTVSFIAYFLSLTELLRGQGDNATPVAVAGVYPSLTMYNEEGECGTGAVVPWAGRLWVITYGPHKPRGSTDKLYEITPGLKQIIRPRHRRYAGQPHDPQGVGTIEHRALFHR